MGRKRNVSLFLVVALALSAAVFAAGCSKKGSASGSEKEPIKIGAVVSLTGTYSGLGTPEKNVIDMEVERVNAAGGINGRKVEVVFEDDATDPGKAQAAAAKLIEQEGVVAIIGATGTGQTMALRPDAERAGVPIVSMAGGSVITDQFSSLVFQTPWANRTVVPFTLKYMQSQGAKKVAFISDSGGYGKDGLEVSKKNLAAYGFTTVADEKFNPGDSDMTTQLTKIKAAKPDFVWLWAAGKEAATVAQNWKQLGAPAPLVGAPGNGRVEFIQGAGDAAEGFTFAAGKILAPDTYGTDSEAYKVATDFVTRYKKLYGKDPDIFAGHAYDAFNIVVEAAKRVQGDVTPQALRDQIEQTSGLTGIGGTFNYSAKDHNGLTENDLVMYGIKSGKWVPVQ